MTLTFQAIKPTVRSALASVAAALSLITVGGQFLLATHYASQAQAALTGNAATIAASAQAASPVAGASTTAR